MNFSAKDIGTSIVNRLDSVKNSASSSMGSFSMTNALSSSKAFLQSNTLISKISFLIMIMIGFLFMLNIGIMALTFFYSENTNPYVVKGLIDGKMGMVISQDPTKASSVTILRSNNENKGLEMTWSVWLYIKDPGSSSSSRYQHIFNKGNGTYNDIGQFILSQAASVLGDNADGVVGMSSDYLKKVSGFLNSSSSTMNNMSMFDKIERDSVSGSTMDTAVIDSIMKTGLASVNNGPGLYVETHATSCSLFVIMDTVDSLIPTRSVEVDNIPINKWVHVAMRIENTLMDVYVNGTITSRTKFTAVPKQNYNDVQICQNGGFEGNLSNLRYFSHALSAFEINNIVKGGPSLTAANNTGSMSSKNAYYLSDGWYNSKLM